jgi:hypothetical protein
VYFLIELPSMARHRLGHREGDAMAQRRLVSAGGAEFYVELADGGGPAPIRDDGGVLDFAGVRATVEGIAGELAQAWEKVKPSEASVAFGLKLTAKSGKLTGLVVEGGAEATIAVTLVWRQAGETATPADPGGTSPDNVVGP